MKPGVLGEWKDPNHCDFSRVFTRHVDHEYAKLMRTENIETGNAKKDRKNRYKSVNRRIKVITKERRDQRTPEFYQEYPRLDAHWCGAWGGFGHLERSGFEQALSRPDTQQPFTCLIRVLKRKHQACLC